MRAREPAPRSINAAWAAQGFDLRSAPTVPIRNYRSTSLPFVLRRQSKNYNGGNSASDGVTIAPIPFPGGRWFAKEPLTGGPNEYRNQHVDAKTRRPCGNCPARGCIRDC